MAEGIFSVKKSLYRVIQGYLILVFVLCVGGVTVSYLSMPIERHLLGPSECVSQEQFRELVTMLHWWHGVGIFLAFVDIVLGFLWYRWSKIHMDGFVCSNETESKLGDPSGPSSAETEQTSNRAGEVSEG